MTTDTSCHGCSRAWVKSANLTDMTRRPSLVASGLLAALLAHTAHADAPDDEPDDAKVWPVPTGPDYVIRSKGERSTKNLVILAGLGGGGALLAGLGLYFHVDSRDASNRVTATTPTNHPWSADDQASYDDAYSSRTKAIVFYSIGGAALVAAAVYLIASEPPEEETLIHPHRSFTPKVEVAPTGALVGGSWLF